MIVIVLWLFLTLPWVGLQCVIVVFPDHTHNFLASKPICYKNFIENIWIEPIQNVLHGKIIRKYSKTCVKRPLKNRQNMDLNDKW